MAATYVTVAELRSNLGIGSLYNDSTVEECCQAAQDQINSFLWLDSGASRGDCIGKQRATVMWPTPAYLPLENR
jgi:hypothetical protein